MRFRMIAAVSCTAVMVGLAGCATSYSSEGITGGYDQKQLEPEIWRVSFNGNGFTTAETVQTFWLYRCAELTLEKGYSGFQIVSNIQLVSLGKQTTADVELIPVHGGGGGGFVYVPMDTAPKPHIEADIKLLRQPFTPNAPKIFDAAALKATLEPFVKGKLCDGNVCAHVHRYLLPPGQSV